MPHDRVLFLKAHVAGHTRTTKTGKVVQVTDYDTHAPGRQTAKVQLQKQKRDGSNYAHVHPPTDLHPDAVGFVARRADRPERFALYRRDGSLSNSFGREDDIHAVHSALDQGGFRGDEKGHVFRKG